MKFYPLRDSEKIKKIEEEISSRYKKTRESYGGNVRYTMPRLPNRFEGLRDLIANSKLRERFYEIYYYIETKSKYIKILIPASEYYTTVFDAVSDKLYSVSLGIKRIKEILRNIDIRYNQTRVELPRTSQPSFDLVLEVYSLKAETVSLIFNIRSTLDCLSTLFHFLYGPNSA